MRISDWSSDVCSSELGADAQAGDGGDPVRTGRAAEGTDRRGQAAGGAAAGAADQFRPGDDRGDRLLRGDRKLFALPDRPTAWRAAADPVRISARKRAAVRRRAPPDRSEEHTSELQSLMRISYAVFCLKKKKHKQR